MGLAEAYLQARLISLSFRPIVLSYVISECIGTGRCSTSLPLYGL